jgi:transposase
VTAEHQRGTRLSDRTWTCQKCNRTHDRDIEAAKNIKRMAPHPKNFVPQDMREMLGEVGNG